MYKPQGRLVTRCNKEENVSMTHFPKWGHSVNICFFKEIYFRNNRPGHATLSKTFLSCIIFGLLHFFVIHTVHTNTLKKFKFNNNGVCESIQESVFDRSKCSRYMWYTSVWSPFNLQADAAFIIEISCTSKVSEMFKNDRIIVKTGLAWCPKPDLHDSAALYAINRHSIIRTRTYQGLRSIGPQR